MLVIRGAHNALFFNNSAYSLKFSNNLKEDEEKDKERRTNDKKLINVKEVIKNSIKSCLLPTFSPPKLYKELLFQLKMIEKFIFL